MNKRTLFVRNQAGGMIWQVYHVENADEANVLARNARKNYFGSVTLVPHEPEYEETFPNWREESKDYMPKAISELTALNREFAPWGVPT